MSKSVRHALILAAGKGTRFKSDKPKVLHTLCGKPMISYLLDRLPGLGVDKTFVVIGHGGDQVRESLSNYPVEFINQEQQLGTGHAVMVSKPSLENLEGNVIVLYGDTPLIATENLQELFSIQEKSGADEALLTVAIDDPTGYGRIIRDSEGRICDIIEEKDATSEQRKIREINPGFVCFSIPALVQFLPHLTNQNKSGEFYLTDMVKVLRRSDRSVETHLVEASRDILGINSRQELSEASLKLRARINERWMAKGVTLVDPSNIYIDATVTIQPDTVIYPGVVIEGECSIGAGCTIHGYCHIQNSTLEDGVMVDYCSVVRKSKVGCDSRVGPFAHLRMNCRLGKRVRFGNFVEGKNLSIEDDTSAAHLSYLGDSKIGEGVNIGAGTITCNYDGVKKSESIIEDDVFVGSDCQLIAPVRLGRGSIVAAGSTITDDVPEDALAIARCRQNVRPGWAKGKLTKRKKSRQ